MASLFHYAWKITQAGFAVSLPSIWPSPGSLSYLHPKFREGKQTKQSKPRGHWLAQAKDHFIEKMSWKKQRMLHFLC